MTIAFREVKNFGRLDYVPLTEQAKALAALKGRNLNQNNIQSLLASGLIVEISSDRRPFDPSA